jgi:Ca-activated chloride channel family protein
MTRLTATCLAAAAIGVAAVSARAQQPVFSTRVDTVRVDVDVVRGDKPITSLTAADFEVLDNGVAQQVQLVSPQSVPISVVLALDTSSSLGQRERTHLAAAGARVVDALQAQESAALLTFSERIAIPSLFTSDTSALKTLLAMPTAAGDTALHDAAHAAMLVGATAPGRPIVILFSDGDDTASFLGADAVLEPAQRTGAVVCVVMTHGEGSLLRQLATTTGGVFVKETSLARVGTRFTEMLESVRRRYLISFTPTGVDTAGWHRLTVKVKGGGEVRARSGYWAEAAPVPPSPR